MIDSEIIKALECCCKDNYEGDCPNCPLQLTANCNVILAEHALNLINRRNAEIEEKNELIERLQNANIQALRGTTEIVKANARVEAIKEFAERLKERSRKMQSSDFNGEFWDRAVLVEDIDNLVKEMVGAE